MENLTKAEKEEAEIALTQLAMEMIQMHGYPAFSYRKISARLGLRIGSVKSNPPNETLFRSLDHGVRRLSCET